MSANEMVGRAVCSKMRRQRRTNGYYQAARNLRKQGFGIGLARLILLGRF